MSKLKKILLIFLPKTYKSPNKYIYNLYIYILYLSAVTTITLIIIICRSYYRSSQSADCLAVGGLWADHLWPLTGCSRAIILMGLSTQPQLDVITTIVSQDYLLLFSMCVVTLHSSVTHSYVRICVCALSFYLSYTCCIHRVIDYIFLSLLVLGVR
jgi:hypothetical protein